MRIIECYIESFGALKNLKKIFSDGLNPIREDNGSGKSTLAGFIKAMLYGLSDSKKAALSENERKRYLPWDGSRCAGSLSFEVNGKRYRVERSFGKRTSEDTFRLYDLKTGRESGDYGADLGVSLFGIDADGFERTVFFSERALKPSGENTTLSAKLSDLSEVDGDIAALDRALEALEDQRRFYFRRGGSGELSSLGDEIRDAEKSLADSESAAKEVTELWGRIDRLTRQADRLKKEIKEQRSTLECATLTAARDTAEMQIEGLRAGLDDARARRDAIFESFGGNVPTVSEVNDALLMRREAEMLEARRREGDKERCELESLRAYFGDRCSDEEVASVREAIEKNATRPHTDGKSNRRSVIDEIGTVKKSRHFEGRPSRVILTLEILFFILFAAGSLAGYLIKPLYYFVGAAGLGAFIISVIAGSVATLCGRRKYERMAKELLLRVTGEDIPRSEIKRKLLLLEERYSEEEKEEAERETVVKDFVAKFFTRVDINADSTAKDLIARYDRMMSLSPKKTKEAEDLPRIKELYEKSAEFLQRYGMAGDSDFSELLSRAMEYEAAKGEVERLGTRIESLRSMSRIGESEEGVSRLEKIRAGIARLEEEEERVQGEIAVARQRQEMLSKVADEGESHRRRISELTEKHGSYSENLEVIRLTKKHLCEASEAITARYLSGARESFRRYAEEISGDGGEYGIDTDFVLSRTEQGVMRGIDSYSRGCSELYLFAARLALSDSMYGEGERPPLILDDPFTALDDKRCERALGLVRSLGKSRQIIYFTCSLSRMP